MMKEEHIIELLEQAPLAALSEVELNTIRAHASVCQSCLKAYEAAQLATLLVKERAAETFEPSPFFQTRVMATWRERQTVGSPLRMWKAAKTLVSAMAATVAALAVLTFVVPNAGTEFPPVAASGYSAEEVIMGQESSSAEQMSYEQVLATLYAADDNEAR
jgi:uncharacterized protein YcaQ